MSDSGNSSTSSPSPGVIGVAGLFITNAVYDLLFLHLGAGPVTSTTAATIVAAIGTYLGNRYWSFRTRQRTGVVREFHQREPSAGSGFPGDPP